MSRTSLFLPLGIFVLIVVVGYVGFSLGDRHVLNSALIGQPFPAFSAPRLDAPGEYVARDALLGRPTLVNVWATWCPTCKAEHEELMRIAEISDVYLVGLNYKDDRYKALKWLADFGDPYDVVIMDGDGAIGVDLGVYGAPETFLLDRQGRVVYKRVGEVNRRIWLEEIVPRLAAMGLTPNAAETDS